MADSCIALSYKIRHCRKGQQEGSLDEKTMMFPIHAYLDNNVKVTKTLINSYTYLKNISWSISTKNVADQCGSYSQLPNHQFGRASKWLRPSTTNVIPVSTHKICFGLILPKTFIFEYLSYLDLSWYLVCLDTASQDGRPSVIYSSELPSRLNHQFPRQ